MWKGSFIFLTWVGLKWCCCVSMPFRWRLLSTAKDGPSASFLISHCISKNFILFPHMKDLVSVKHIVWNTSFYPTWYFTFRLFVHSHSDTATFGMWLIIVLLPVPFCFYGSVWLRSVHRWLLQKWATHLFGKPNCFLISPQFPSP